MAMSYAWAREQVSYCYCAALSYAHAHCPCNKCDGKAVSRSPEYRHWQEASLLSSQVSRERTSPVVELSASQTPGDQDLNERTTTSALTGATTSTAVSTALDRDETGQDVDRDIAVAIVKAFSLIEEMGGSQKNLLDIVAFGRELYCKGSGNSQAHILVSLFAGNEKCWLQRSSEVLCVLESESSQLVERVVQLYRCMPVLSRDWCN